MEKLETVCWVLHRRPYQQSSVILELLSAQGEHLAVVARAARSMRRRAYPPPALCSRLRIWYRKGRAGSDLYSLAGSEPEKHYLLSGKALLYALRANELIVRGTRRLDIHPTLPELYGDLMQALSTAETAGKSWRAAYTLFQLSLLAALGYGLDLHRDREGRAVSAQQLYRLRSDCQLEQVEDGWRGEVLQAIARGDLSRPDTLGIAEEIVRKTLQMAAVNLSN